MARTPTHRTARTVLAAALAGALALSLAPAPAAAQCSAGQAIYHGCFGIPFQGCCTLKNTNAGIITTVQWCENGWLCAGICNPYLGQVCGWVVVDASSGLGVYDCTDYQSMDPSGAVPYECQIPCGDTPAEGCCEGQTLLKYCRDGSLNIIDCSANAAGAQYCGWDPIKQDYTCTVGPIAGPSGHPYACGGTACLADCAGKQCGSDGCGGQCGTCTSGTVCDIQGACVQQGCQAKCDGKDCGPDGCGGSCGTCPGVQVCNGDQHCAPPPCTPECTNKECGSDLCGGSCGSCMPPYVCAAWFKCADPSSDDLHAPDFGPAPDVDEADGVRPIPDGTSVRIDPGPHGGQEGCPDGWVAQYGYCISPPVEDLPTMPRAKTYGCAAPFHHP